jgi:hypothetical protein
VYFHSAVLRYAFLKDLFKKLLENTNQKIIRNQDATLIDKLQNLDNNISSN